MKKEYAISAFMAAIASSKIMNGATRSLYGDFANIAYLSFEEGEKSYKSLIELNSDLVFPKLEDGIQFFQDEFIKHEHVIRACSITIVFAGIAVEAFINYYIVRASSKGMLNDHLDRLSLESKWLIAPKYLRNVTIDPGCKEMNQLRELIKLRNELVHSKPKIVTPEATQTQVHTAVENARRACAAMMDIFQLLASLDDFADKLLSIEKIMENVKAREK